MELSRWITTVGEKLGETQNQAYLNEHFDCTDARELKKYVLIAEQYRETFERAIRIRSIDLTKEIDIKKVPKRALSYMIEYIGSLDWENDREAVDTLIMNGFSTVHHQLTQRLVLTLEQYHDLINTFIETHIEPEEFEGLSDGFRILDFMNRYYEDGMLPETYERMIRENFNQDDYVNLANTLISITENQALIDEVLGEAFK